jgi:CBS domain-containing protein
VKKIIASEVMTRDVLTVPSDLPVDRVIELLVNHSISGAPVVSVEGKPVGVVSLSDLAKSGAIVETYRGTGVSAYFRHGLQDSVAREDIDSFRFAAESHATAADIMTPVVFSVEDQASVQEVANAMIRGRIHRVLVTRGGRIVGIISSMDLLPIVRDM